MTPFLLNPNLDHKVSLPRTTNQNIVATEFDIRENDIVLNGILPQTALGLNISKALVDGVNKLEITNYGLITVTLVDIVKLTHGNSMPISTEIHRGKSIKVRHYVDFADRYFAFSAFTFNSKELKVVKLGINTTSDDKMLFLEYKILY